MSSKQNKIPIKCKNQAYNANLTQQNSQDQVRY